MLVSITCQAIPPAKGTRGEYLYIRLTTESTSVPQTVTQCIYSAVRVLALLFLWHSYI